MRKLFLILLLAVLPLQYAWSAAAAYCEHEQGKSMHFGHHSHQHAEQAGHDDDDGHSASDDGHQPPAKGKVHADCAVCQFSVQASLLDSLAPPPGQGGAVYPPDADPRFSSHIADGPKRPDWRPAA